MIDIKNKCTGCSACSSICHVNAISMLEDEEGFLQPVIDKNKCTNCGLCEKTCPVLNSKYENSPKPRCYAVMAEDKIRIGSSSGGVFPVLAYHFLEQGGYVAGAVWNSSCGVEHIISNRKEDIERMRGSKYLQSSMNNCYQETKKVLDEGGKVLFTGTPCQIAGLYAFLKKEYENLHTTEIICHGTPSPKVFRKYLEEELAKDEEFIETNFRDKKQGWSSELTTTTTTKRCFSKNKHNDNYMRAFLNNLCLRKSCGECKFNRMPRQADITIGDFWGVDKYNKKYNDKKGTSIILVNNQKGQKLLNMLGKEFKFIKKVPLEYAIQGNPNLIKPSKLHCDRKIFFELLNAYGLSKSLKETEQIKYDGVILNYWCSNNYGALWTAYCLQQYLMTQFNKDFRLLDWKADYWKKEFENSFCNKFAKDNLSLTKEFKQVEDLKELNTLTDTFIVGSDQVFRYSYMKNIKDVYLLDFTDLNKKRIAFSASFGVDKFEGNQNETYEVKKSLKRFDAISTREDSGVNICKENFDITAEHILDPVFLVEKDIIEKLIDKKEEKYKDKIVTYILDDDMRIRQNVKSLSTKLNKEAISIEGKNVSLQEWLTAIYDCDYFITDSFHGACCAIIFHKPFLCLKNNERGSARFDSIEKTFNIRENFVYSIEEIQNVEKLNRFIIWVDVEKVLITEREKAYQWLKKALETNKKIDNETLAIELDFLHSKKSAKQIVNNYMIAKKISFWEKIFSVRNEISGAQKRKVMKILGIKFKFKVRGLVE